MADDFSARLCQQRERQGITLTEIATQTKISVSLLEGLERGDLSHWPSGIFRRAFIRAYAKAIGLNPDTVVREFIDLYPEAEVVPATPLAAADAAWADSEPPASRLRCWINSATDSMFGFRRQALPTSVVPQAPAINKSAQPIKTDVVKTAAFNAGSIKIEDAADAVLGTSVVMPETVKVESVNTEAVNTEDVNVENIQPPASLLTSDPDWSAVARLCTEFAGVLRIHEIRPLLERASRLLDAVGLVVWIWDAHWAALRPLLSHGYPETMLAQIPKVRRDAGNATADSFRSAQLRVVDGRGGNSGAVVAPLMTPEGCVGVLAVELSNGGEQRESVHALATIFAAQLATFVGVAPLADAVNE